MNKILTVEDLIVKVLEGRVRDRSKWVEYANSLHYVVVWARSVLTTDPELDVITVRYNLKDFDVQDSSIARAAEFAKVSVSKARSLEASAIKRLGDESEYFGLLVKNFGSKELLIQEIDLAHRHRQDYVDQHMIEGVEFPDDELSQILKSLEMVNAIFMKHIAMRSRTVASTLHSLGLSERVVKALTWNKITTVKELCAMTGKELLRRERIGVRTLKEIKDVLAKHGLKLAA